MPVPEFNEIKAPALQFFAKNPAPHKNAEIYAVLAKHFSLTEAEQTELLPSGTQPRWHNRANWACYDLYRAGLLERPKRGLYAITETGKNVAAQNPTYIDREFLMQFPQFVDFSKTTSAKKTPIANGSDHGNGSADPAKTQTPEELIGSAHQMLRVSLKKEVLELVRKMDPYKFERLVVELLVAMGYGGSYEEAAQVTKASGDEGIDGVINEDRLGLDIIYLQAKRWQNTVGRKEIQSFVGALAGRQASKGVFITTSDFAETASDYAKKVPQKVILIDGDRLADLMIQHNIGVSKAQTYEVKRVDFDYFEEE